jgi:hypothetical protein
VSESLLRLPWQKPEREEIKPGYADYETLLTDPRVERIASRVFDEFRAQGLPDDTDFVTFVQPPQVIDRGGVAVPIPEVAVFAVISDNPRHKGHRVMTQGSVWLRDWMARERELRHYASDQPDPALSIFRLLVRDHLPKLQNLREMI